MKRYVKHITLCIMMMAMVLGLSAMEVSAAEVRTGTLGTNNGVQWRYDEDTKILTLTGSDSGLDTYYPRKGCIYEICSDVEKIILQDFKPVGSAEQLFANLGALKEIEMNGFDTSEVNSMYSMFEKCGSLSSLDLSSFETSNVTNMKYMFSFCSSLSELDLSSFNTSNVTGMRYMFNRCSNLKEVTGLNFDTAKVTDMCGMFSSCSILSKLDLSSFNTSNVTDMSYMFHGCNGLTELDLSSFDTGNVKNMGALFYECKSLEQLDLSGFNTANATSMAGMFNGCSGLKSLDVSKFNTAKVTDMSWMFYMCENLTSLNVSGFNTTNATDISSMFYDCSNLEQVDVSRFDTSKVTDMSSMFAGCQKLETLDVSNFDTSEVTDMSWMFDGCSTLTALDVSGFDTADVTEMYYMFGYCSNLSSLDVSGFDTSKVTDMAWMFAGCSNLKNLDVSNFDTSNVVYMNTMFYGCSSLPSLDVSGFNTAKVTDMSRMFASCAGLKELDVSNFDTSNVSNMSYMFGYSSSLTELDMSHFDTSNVIDISAMFQGCSGLSSLDLSRFDTTKVSNMEMMFWDCHGLKRLDISGFTITTNKTDYMLLICYSLEEIRTPKEIQSGIVLSLPATFTDSAGNKLNSITGEHCNTVLTRKAVSIELPEKLVKGECKQLRLKTDDEILDISENEKYEWESNAEAIVTVSANGTVNAVGTGVCIINLFEKSSGQWVANGSIEVVEEQNLAITNNPSNITIDEGTSAVFKITAVGNGLKYQWQFRKSSEGAWVNSGMAGSNTNSITVVGTKARDGYQYRCVVTDASGNQIISEGATLSIQTAGATITGQPASKTVTEGERATFKVTATGTGLTYQWQFRTSESASWKNSGMTGSTTDSITVQGTKSRNGYQYRCVVTDVSGKTVTSSAATLTIQAGLAITGQPESKTVTEGERATFKVTATGTGLTYQWQFRTSETASWKNSGMAGSTTKSITVQGTKARNGYQYRCVVTDANGNKVTSNAATLTIQAGLAITGQPESKTVTAGENATFKVTAIGTGLTYQWQFRISETASWKNSGMTGSKTKSITVQGTKARDGYQYRCIVTDANGNKVTSNAATLTIRAGLAITGQPESKTVAVGENATFTVTATGTGLTYQWQFKTVGADTWTNSGMTGSKTNSITVQGTKARNGYQYRCVITDGSGNKVTSNGATLNVK